MRARDIIHIHVGKCAGSALNQCLHEADINFSELHGPGASGQLDAILHSGIEELLFIITLRDPIARFVSAFNYDRHRTMTGEGHKVGDIQKKLWQTVFNCFSTPNSLAEGLSSPEIGTQRLAQWACSRSSSLHTGLGVADYISMDAALRLPAEHTHLVHQESLSSDVPILFTKLGYPAPSQIPVVNSRAMFQTTRRPPMENLSEISVTGRKNLQRHLANDYLLMRTLEQRPNGSSATD